MRFLCINFSHIKSYSESGVIPSTDHLEEGCISCPGSGPMKHSQYDILMYSFLLHSGTMSLTLWKMMQ